ncbi:NUDIX domain-containing protein [Desmospora activa]|uniref:NUDIX domain-containing protein n=1 Tax=Desmospora activa TaxID=500615 RepID=UPI000D3058B4|nr:NUDIX domain-containing protein [Desmospora activa]
MIRFSIYFSSYFHRLNKKIQLFYWNLPVHKQGKVEYMETIEDAVSREVYEEIGIKIKLKALFHQ